MVKDTKNINGTKSSKQIISKFTLILYYRNNDIIVHDVAVKKITHTYCFRKRLENARLLSNGPKLANCHIDLHFVDLNL